MATATFNVRIDMRNFFGYDFFAQAGTDGVTANTPTSLDYHSNTGWFYTYSGTDLSGSSRPESGTVTGWDFGKTEVMVDPNDPWHPVSRDFSYWTFTGLSIPAAGAEGFSGAIGRLGFDLAIRIPAWFAGNDTMNGSAYDDYLLGYEGADILKGNAGSDTLEGGAGNDKLDGGVGADMLIGGVGNDTYIVERAGDTVTEESLAGIDRVYSSVGFTLGNNVENLTLTGASAINGKGNELANIVVGNGAANHLFGFGGADTLNGSGGADSVDGGAARDVLTGGTEADLFIFRDGDFGGATKSTADKITDFNHVEGDRIDLHLVDSNTAIDGNQGFTFIGNESFHNVAGELRYQEISGNTFVYGDTNGDGDADFMIRLDGSHALVAGDFIL